MLCVLLCLGKQFCVGGVRLGRLVIKIVAFLCAEGFLVVLGVVGVMVRSGVVRGRCIVRYGLEHHDFLSGSMTLWAVFKQGKRPDVLD